ncbi:cytosol aminopeptidase-like isoform X2 [Ischnura elegans]|uniref:cytosol aminopeptidase-like isoform X2 n=1 Tax=Ischnura elegans TaxID=197161 RepID=UPI001ED8AFDD|nr:cytosol aminopeptidase-like isoform X2 [Ischnura elegans]
MATRMLFVAKNIRKELVSTSYRNYSSDASAVKRGLVLGVYSDGDKKGELKLTSSAENFNQKTSGKFGCLLQKSGPPLKKGKSRVLFDLDECFSTVAVVGLGKQQGCAEIDEQENIDQGKESIRMAASAGCRSLKELEVDFIELEDFGQAEAAAEGGVLGLWTYAGFRCKTQQKKKPHLCPHGELDRESWDKGMVKAEAQNFARLLMETPGNHMSPTIFAQVAKEELSKNGVHVEVRDKCWAESMKMGSFLSVAKGSAEPPVFLEIKYCGRSDEKDPIALVGKGVTFDSGGISLKSPSKMDEMRADMGGAACVVATINALALLKVPVNVMGFIPLCENMPSGTANKPGDVVIAMNGKSIKVDNTDAEGRLILADALCYAQSFNPQFTLDIATLTGAMRVALGSAATGVFTNSSCLWQKLECAGALTGDRVWRFPLWKHYTKEISDISGADLNNLGKGTGGGSCTAAAFLKEFVARGDWMHLDIAGVMSSTGESPPYISRGMAGRPTRTLIEFLSQFSGQ